jgi:hypothetical protein
MNAEQQHVILGTGGAFVLGPLTAVPDTPV